MLSFNNWMVGLDFSKVDEALINYVRYLSTVLKPVKIFFIHVIRDRDFHHKLNKEENIEIPTKDQVLSDLKKAAREEDFNVSVEHMVFEGDASFELWRETYVYDVDLFAVGHKSVSEGRGALPKKFVRKSFCSVLFVPETSPASIEKILVPVDFSDLSKISADLAFKLASKSNASVALQHVFDAPHGYFYQRMSKEKYLAAYKEYISLEFEHFVTRVATHDLDFERIISNREEDTVAEQVLETAVAKNVNFILMSAGGKSRLSQLFLGSVTEKMVQLDKTIPLLIVKQKIEDVSLLDILTTV